MRLAYAAEGDDCRAHLEVVGATATFKTPLFQGKAVRRDVVIDVQLASTATVPISEVELGVFLGASLRAIEENRPSALPTTRLRELEGGGVAFRAEASTLIAPNTTRVVRLEKSALPMDKDLSSVTAVIAGCKTLEAVGEATVEEPVAPPDPTYPGLGVAALVLAVIMVVVLIVRGLR